MKNSQQHGYITSMTFEPKKKRHRSKATQEQFTRLEWLVGKGMRVEEAAATLDIARTTAYTHLQKKKAKQVENVNQAERAPQSVVGRRTKQQMRKDAASIIPLIVQGLDNDQVARELGLTIGQINHQIARYKLRQKAKPRIACAKPTLWQKIKKTITNFFGE
jgi:transposase